MGSPGAGKLRELNCKKAWVFKVTANKDKKKFTTITVIIPVLNEEEMLLKNANHFEDLKRTAELIIVDGGSCDRTIELASKFGKVLKSKNGRAVQMNLGAKEAKGDILLFLHADSFLNSNALSDASECINRGTIGGCFTQRLNNDLPVYRKIEKIGNIRAKKKKIFYGDQGIFVRSDVFFKLGGFPEVPVMEDMLFSKKLRRAGKVKCLDSIIYVSARRWENHGFIRTNFIYFIMLQLFSLHVPLRIIKYFYKDKR